MGMKTKKKAEGDRIDDTVKRVKQGAKPPPMRKTGED
jgi:hypothetical protein